MTAFKSRLFATVAVAVAVGAAAAGGVWASGNAGPPAAPVPATATCPNAPLPPADAEVNTMLDKEHGLLTYSFFDSAKAADTTATIDYKDARCLSIPVLQRVVDHVLATDSEAQVQICASIKQRVAANDDTMHGVKINLGAARQYISDWC